MGGISRSHLRRFHECSVDVSPHGFLGGRKLGFHYFMIRYYAIPMFASNCTSFQSWQFAYSHSFSSLSGQIKFNQWINCASSEMMKSQIGLSSLSFSVYSPCPTLPSAPSGVWKTRTCSELCWYLGQETPGESFPSAFGSKWEAKEIQACCTVRERAKSTGWVMNGVIAGPKT